MSPRSSCTDMMVGWPEKAPLWYPLGGSTLDTVHFELASDHENTRVWKSKISGNDFSH